MSDAPVIEVVNLSKHYSGHTAVDQVSFRIHRGEIVGFLGPNGAGKSTTMRILATFQPATQGTVRIAGHDVFHQTRAAQRAIGYMPEHNPLPLEMRVWEYLRFRAQLRGLRDPKRLDQVIEQCDLRGVERRIIGQLSKGFRQRIGLADALMHRPDLVLLDEPTAGLDPNQIRSVRELIRSLAPEMTVLLSSHILPEVALTCDRVIILHQGVILADESTGALQQRFREFSRVIAEIKAHPEATTTALRQLRGVHEVQTEPLDGGYHRFHVRAKTSEDLRPKIFALVQQQGGLLRELRQRESTLEEVFTQLTRTSKVA